MLYGGNYALLRLNFANVKNKKLLIAIKKINILLNSVGICSLFEFVLCSPHVCFFDGVFYRGAII